LCPLREIVNQTMAAADLKEPLLKVEEGEAKTADVPAVKKPDGPAPGLSCLEILKDFATKPAYWPVFVMMCVAIGTFACLIYYEAQHAFLRFGLVLIFMALFLMAQVNGTYTVYTSVQLQEQIDTFKVENEEFAASNEKLESSITSLTSENEEIGQEVKKLDASVEKMKETTDKMKSELAAFKAIKEKMAQYADSMGDDLQKSMEQADRLVRKMDAMTEDNEKTLLYKALSDLEFMDADEGLSKEEYDKFIERIPAARKAQFLKLAGDFETLAKGAETVSSDDVGDIIDKLVKLDPKEVC